MSLIALGAFHKWVHLIPAGAVRNLQHAHFTDGITEGPKSCHEAWGSLELTTGSLAADSASLISALCRDVWGGINSPLGRPDFTSWQK